MVVEFLGKYRAVWLFLFKFFAVYITGVLLYNFYLGYYTTHIDMITEGVTEQVARIFSWSLPEISTFYSGESPVAEIRYFDVPLVLLIEGCNAISVMILFVAFVIAFKGKFQRYLWFIPLGITILYLANLIRIYFIGMIVLYLPDYTTWAHDYIFPGIIYGTTFLLWVVWVKFLADK
ncbi:exosortase family protein XrtF [bacterium SCSIO 12643]|nr:exosortase family protein XrtF [bacterium SCSIO 12643]